VRGTLRFPAAFSLEPPGFAPDSADTLELALESEPLPLEELGPYLPAAIALAGTLQVSARVSRAAREELDLAGQADLRSFRLDLDDGSWTEASGSLEIAGTSRAPVVQGRVRVDGGVIVLPELPPDLLPAEGEAVLWADETTVVMETQDPEERESTPEEEEGAGSGAPPDSAAAPPRAEPPGSPPPPDAATADFAPELNVKITIPNSIFLRGRELQVELRGELHLDYRNGQPVVLGELEATRGTLRFLGRQFQVKRGFVTFYGDPETDPVLDLTLEARISGTTYRISVTGEAAKPDLELSSDPSMSDGDIVASILFGKPIDQLDEGQENLLQARMVAILAQYGASSVSADLTRALGVDMISYDDTAGNGSGALTIGKYLNPRTLVKYEQIIDREIAYLLRLEYALTEALKLETAFGQGTASGVGLEWSRDY
jgi:autotransporter translocation and assembly factor TamB